MRPLPGTAEPSPPPPSPGPDPGGREERWGRLAEGGFDLLVVGGGITGAGIASLAAQRGFHVALVEREDWGGGTSGATSKMLHGGLRYLAQRKFSLVREGVRERGLLLRALGERQVQRTPFLLPLQGPLGARLSLRFGTWLYQRMSGSLALGPRRLLSPEEVLAKVPFLAHDGLRGGVLYYEGVVDDILLTVFRVGEAAQNGAVAMNHVEAVRPLVVKGKVGGAELRDRIVDRSCEVSARTVINAAGVWAGGWAGADRSPRVRPARGAHLVLRRARLPLETAVVLAAPEGRWVFALPYGPCTIVGTTDTDHEGDPARVRATATDVEYLLGVANAAFPSLRLGLADIVDVYAGLRPLVAGTAERTGDLSREDVVHQDPSGLLTVVGGKLTTHRAMAGRALAGVGTPRAGRTPRAGSWAFPPTWDGGPCPGVAVLDRAARLVASERVPLLAPWVASSVQATGAATLADLMDRRFHAVQRLDPVYPDLVGEVARIAAPLLGWSEAQLAGERDDYLSRLRYQTEAVEELRRSPPVAGRSPSGRPPR